MIRNQGFGDFGYDGQRVGSSTRFLPSTVLDSFLGDQGYCSKRNHPIYYEMLEGTQNAALPGSPYYNARTYSKAELDGLFSLARYLLRTAMIESLSTNDQIAHEHDAHAFSKRPRR